MIFILIGTSVGILSSMGLGGGIILIPILTNFFQFSQIEAQAINVIYFIPTAIISLIFHSKNKLLDVKSIKAITPYSLIGVIVGIFLSMNIPTLLLSKLFGLFLINAGIKQIIKSKEV